MATLTHYIATSRKKRTQDEWAREFGISRSHLSEILAGKVRPGWKTMLKIQSATKSKVTPNDWARGQE